MWEGLTSAPHYVVLWIVWAPNLFFFLVIGRSRAPGVSSNRSITHRSVMHKGRNDDGGGSEGSAGKFLKPELVRPRNAGGGLQTRPSQKKIGRIVIYHSPGSQEAMILLTTSGEAAVKIWKENPLKVIEYARWGRTENVDDVKASRGRRCSRRPQEG